MRIGIVRKQVAGWTTHNLRRPGDAASGAGGGPGSLPFRLDPPPAPMADPTVTRAWKPLRADPRNLARSWKRTSYKEKLGMNPVVPGGVDVRTFPPSDTPPADFPDAVPFIPGVQTIAGVAEDGRAIVCTWMVERNDEEAAQAYRDEMHAVAGAAQEAGLEPPATGGVPDLSAIKASYDRLPGSLRDRMRSLAQLPAESDERREAGRLLDLIVQAIAADGWEEEEQAPFPGTAGSARLRRGGRMRLLTAGAHPGACAYVNMVESSA
jgi:hypothetical protein